MSILINAGNCPGVISAGTNRIVGAFKTCSTALRIGQGSLVLMLYLYEHGDGRTHRLSEDSEYK